MAPQFLLVGNGARGRGADFDQRLFHFHDEHADHLGRVFRLVEQVGDIGGDDVAGAGKNTHILNSFGDAVCHFKLGAGEREGGCLSPAGPTAGGRSGRLSGDLA